MDAADLELWTTLADKLGLESQAQSRWPEFRRHLDKVADCAELMRGDESRRGMKRHRRRPVSKAQKLAQRLVKGLQALPEEFFSPRYDRQFLDHLADDLRSLEFLADDALDILGIRTKSVSRAQRHEVIGSAVALAFVALAEKQPTCYRHRASGETVGTFPTFLEVIAARVGIPPEEVLAISENRRKRYRSRSASVRPKVRKK